MTNLNSPKYANRLTPFYFLPWFHAVPVSAFFHLGDCFHQCLPQALLIFVVGVSLVLIYHPACPVTLLFKPLKDCAFHLGKEGDFQSNTSSFFFFLKWSVPHNQLFHYLSSLCNYNPPPCTFHLICVCLIDILWLCPAKLLVWTFYKGYSHYLGLSSLDISMVKSLTSFKSSLKYHCFYEDHLDHAI